MNIKVIIKQALNILRHISIRLARILAEILSFKFDNSKINILGVVIIYARGGIENLRGEQEKNL